MPPPPDPGQAPGPVTSRHVARGLGTTVLARLGALVEVVAQPLYVLMFGLAGYGLYAVLWAAINLLENIFDLGMTSALQRTVPRAPDGQSRTIALRTALVLGVGPCLVVAALIAWAAPAVAPLVNVAPADADRVVPAIRLFVWALPLWAFVEIATSALRARMVFGAEIRLRIFWEQLIRLALAAGAWAAGFGLVGLFVAHMASLVLTALLSVRLLAREYDLSHWWQGPWRGSAAGDTARAGIAMLPANITGRLFGDGPALVLNAMLPGARGAEAAALFTIARKLSSIVQLVRTAFVYVLAPLAASAEHQDRAQVAAIYAYAVRLILAIALPLAAVMAAGAAPLLTLFGDQASVAEGALVILLLARAAEAVLGIAQPVLQVVAAYRHQFTASVIGLALAAGLALVLPGLIGALSGITLAMAAGLVVTASIPMLQLAWVEDLRPGDGPMARAALRTVLVTAAGAGLALPLRWLPDAVALPLLLALALASIWASLRWALPPADRASLGKVGRWLG